MFTRDVLRRRFINSVDAYISHLFFSCCQKKVNISVKINESEWKEVSHS